MQDEEFMRRALDLASRGRGSVEPNPMVGAVVVRDGVVVGEGWHERFGEPHAEVNALNQAGEKARGATLYVTLEPCCHHGKTPPCTGAVLAAGIRRVVASMPDPFAAVAGKGVAILREAGVAVEIGLGGPAARRLNAPYLKLLRAGLPWIHAKWAMSADGKFATFSGSSKWITSEAARAKMHKLRGHLDAIVIGSGTLAADDPLLTVRPPGPRTPARVVLSAGGRQPSNDYRMLETIAEAPVIVLTSVQGKENFIGWRERGAEVVGLEDFTPTSAMKELGRRRFTNVLIEGGAKVLGSMLDARLVDEVHAFVAPKIVGGAGAPSPVAGHGVERMDDALQLKEVTLEAVGPDVLIHGYLGDHYPPQELDA